MKHSLTFNGSRKTFIKVLERSRPYWAPRAREVSKVGKSSSRLTRTTVEPITITVKLLIDGSDKEDLLNKAEELAEWLVTEQEKPLVFDDRPNRAYYAAVEGGVDEEEVVSFSTATISFICPDPYKYGAENKLDLKTAYNSFLISGQVNTPWSTVTTFLVAAPTYTLENNQGGIIELNYSFVKGDVLEIDYRKRKVTLNGKNLAVSMSLSTNWFELEPGIRQLRATHPTIIKYEERYY